MTIKKDLPALEIRLENSVSELTKLASRLNGFWKGRQYPDSSLPEVQLILEELLVNIISHGFADQNPHTILVRLFEQQGQIVLEIEDDGQGFNPTEKMNPPIDLPIESRAVGGLGIFLVRRLSDSIEYKRTGRKNVVRITKSLQEG